MAFEAEISKKPMDRLTRLADAARAAIEAHPEYDEKTDRFILSVSDDDRSGFFGGGYDGPAPLIVDLLEHIKGTVESIGAGTLEFVTEGDSGLLVRLKFQHQDPQYATLFEVEDGSIRAAILLKFMPAHTAN